ncbi:hypothetical protein Tsubulata_044110 [Turnera subulata]|uniref:Uncharacterized protein n=1 Tax=Turnera subulata TaxID=218843 RepID=A0A9Q0JLC4_9ROSI|nr:hypothetical protein Tsubulata_044110 [Turnera subulata]
MEGLIPFVYRAIMQYKNGNEGPLGWLNESPSASYIRLPTGDSGRFQTSDMQLFGADHHRYGFSSATSSNVNSTSTSQIIVSAGAQSPLRGRLTTSRRVIT